MKKIFIFCLFFILILTGCGEKKNELTVQETSKKVNEAVEKIKTFKTNVKLNINLGNQKNNYVANVDIDKVNKKLKANVSDGNTSSELFASIDNENNILNLYYKEPDEEDWKYSGIELESIINDYNTYSDNNFDNSITKLIEELFSFENLKQLSASKGTYNYEVTINRSDIINKIIEKLKNENILNDDIKNSIETYFNNIDGSITIKFSLDNENYCFKNITIDFNDLLVKTAIKNGVESKNLEFKIELNFNDFDKKFNYKEPTNTVDYINISRNSASEDAAYGIKKAAQLYYMTILLDSPAIFNEITFNCDGTSCTSANGTKLEIDGVIPTSGSITISENGDVTATGIVINGFLCDIPNTESIVCVN